MKKINEGKSNDTRFRMGRKPATYQKLAYDVKKSDYEAERNDKKFKSWDGTDIWLDDPDKLVIPYGSLPQEYERFSDMPKNPVAGSRASSAADRLEKRDARIGQRKASKAIKPTVGNIEDYNESRIWVTVSELKALIKEMHVKQLQESDEDMCADCGQRIEECEC